MNPDNYASLEASRRLVEAGIVLETEVWINKVDGRRLYKSELTFPDCGPNWIPNPCMAEVWRELPGDDWTLYQLIRKYLMFRGLDFEDYDVVMELIRITRNADALIDLLIWVRKGLAIDAQEGEHELG